MGILVCTATLVALPTPATAAEGSLDQLPGAAGCITEAGRSDPGNASTAGQCTDGLALASAAGAVSPDGRNVSVSHFFNHSISVFSRNPATGALTQLAGTRAA